MNRKVYTYMDGCIPDGPSQTDRLGGVQGQG